MLGLCVVGATAAMAGVGLTSTAITAAREPAAANALVAGDRPLGRTGVRVGQRGQRTRSEPRGERAPIEGNVAYDGRFTFVRLRYNSGFGGGGRRRGGGDPGWFHDYPTADHHLMKILAELTLMPTRDNESNILTLDDPELFKYPLAYMSEPGDWTMSDAEAEGLRAYLLKGGFIIFDDFRGWHLQNLQDQMRRALPDGRFVALDATHPIFHSFFEIDPATFVPPYGGDGPPVFYGVFEDNDPNKRLLLIANHNNDLGEYWEYSNTGMVPIDLSNEAYKFGVNYVVYAMTH